MLALQPSAGLPSQHAQHPRSAHPPQTCLQLCTNATPLMRARTAGSPGPQHPDVEGRALGSAALAYFLSAGSENIGLSSQAAEQLRNGCIEVRMSGGHDKVNRDTGAQGCALVLRRCLVACCAVLWPRAWLCCMRCASVSARVLCVGAVSASVVALCSTTGCPALLVRAECAHSPLITLCAQGMRTAKAQGQSVSLLLQWPRACGSLTLLPCVWRRCSGQCTKCHHMLTAIFRRCRRCAWSYCDLARGCRGQPCGATEWCCYAAALSLWAQEFVRFPAEPDQCCCNSLLPSL